MNIADVRKYQCSLLLVRSQQTKLRSVPPSQAFFDPTGELHNLATSRNITGEKVPSMY